MGVSHSLPGETSTATKILDALVLRTPELWPSYENPTYIIPNTFVFTNEEKLAFIQHHITIGRKFEINQETGNIKKNALSQRKYYIHSLHPILIIDPKSVKFVPMIFPTNGECSTMKASDPPPPHHQEQPNGGGQSVKLVKFSLNFRYTANVDCTIYIHFHGKLHPSTDTLSFEKASFTSCGVNLSAGQKKTFRSKDHHIYGNLEQFPNFQDYEKMKDSFNALKTKLFDVMVLVTPKILPDTTGVGHRHRIFPPNYHQHRLQPTTTLLRPLKNSNSRLNTSLFKLSSEPQGNEISAATATGTSTTTASTSIQSTVLTPFKEVFCFQIDLFTLQKAMEFIKNHHFSVQTLHPNELSKMKFAPADNNDDSSIHSNSFPTPYVAGPSKSRKSSTVVPLLSLPGQPDAVLIGSPTNTARIKFTPTEKQRLNHQLYTDIMTVMNATPHSHEKGNSSRDDHHVEMQTTKLHFPQQDGDKNSSLPFPPIIITQQLIELVYLDHYLELGKGVYQMHPVFGSDHVKLKDPPAVAPRKPVLVMPNRSPLVTPRQRQFVSPKDYLPNETHFSRLSSSEDMKLDEMATPGPIRAGRRRSFRDLSLDALEQKVSPDEPSPPRPEGGEDGEQHLCLICFTNRTNIVLFPCRHYNFCLECSQTMMEKSPKCPVCRVDIQFTINLTETVVI